MYEFEQGEIVIVRPNSKLSRQYGNKDYEVISSFFHGKREFSKLKEKVSKASALIENRYLQLKPCIKSLLADLEILEERICNA